MERDMLGKTGLLILTVLSAILLTDGLNPGQKVIAANPQEERETCTVNKSAKEETTEKKHENT